LHQNDVLEHIGEVACVKKVAVGEHGWRLRQGKFGCRL
jgi:hypothetical protein